MEIFISTLKAFSVRVFFALSMLALWVLAIKIGMFGADEFSRSISLYIENRNILLQVLYGIIELSVGVIFFLLLGKQIFPRGIKPIAEEPITITLTGNAYYLPGIFALGLIVGIAGHGLFLLVALFWR